MPHWKRRASTRIILLLCLQLTLGLLNALFVYYQTALLEDDAEIINMTGVMRGTIQRTVKLALLKADHHECEARVDTLLASFLAYQPGLELHGARDEYYAALDMLQDRWIILKTELGLLGSDPTPGQLERIRFFSEDVWRLSDEVVRLAQETSQSKLARLRWGYAMAALQLITMLAVVWLVWSLVRGRLEPQALRDTLTGLANRRVFDDMLPRLVAMAHRYDKPLSLICFDLDHFKVVNDTLGHAAGDEVLRKVSRTVDQNVRASDVFCRTGGEEFSLICPLTDPAQAGTLAEKLLCAVREADMSPAKSITISLGVGSLRPGETPASLQERADALLYAAKHSGRDRVILDAVYTRGLSGPEKDLSYQCPIRKPAE